MKIKIKIFIFTNEFQSTAAFRENGNPFGSPNDDNKHKKYEKPPRPETANNHENKF